MRIAVIVDGWFPSVGGGQINVWEISKRIASKNLQIDILTRNQGKDNLPKVKNLKIIQFGKVTHINNLPDQILFALKLIPFLLRQNYDIVHTHPFIPALTAKLVSIIKRKPIILTVHGTRLFSNQKKLSPGLVIEYLIIKVIRYDVVISVTLALEKLANPKQQVVVIPNGVDYQRFKNLKVKTVEGKILWVGRFDPIKRVDILLKAYEKVKQVMPKISLTLVGYGYLENELKALSIKMKLQDIAFKGKLIGNDLFKEYKSSSVFVLPSDSEGQPITILEAQAAGLPVVAANVGGIPELIKNHKTGILVSPGNVKALVDGMLEALKNRKRMATSVQNNKFTTWDSISKKTYRIYKDVLH